MVRRALLVSLALFFAAVLVAVTAAPESPAAEAPAARTYPPTPPGPDFGVELNEKATEHQALEFLAAVAENERRADEERRAAEAAARAAAAAKAASRGTTRTTTGRQPSAPPPPDEATPGSNRALGQQMAAEAPYYWTGEQWACLDHLWGPLESGWNERADNPTSAAYGIPQANPGSKMGAGWQWDPVVQIRWGLGYVLNRYGTPCKARAFRLARGYY